MMRWLEGNPAGQVLAGVVGGLLVLVLVLGVVWSLPPRAAGAGADSPDQPMQVEVPHLPESPPIETFAVVTDRPVFNESRQPELESESTAEGEDAESLAEDLVEAPELVLAGVVITPSLRMVTLRPKKARESIVAFEGQPLQGDYGSWRVKRIEPREITLAAGDGRELQLPLQVHKATIEPPPKPKPAEVAAKQSAPAAAGEEDRPLTRAEEIRQRIAARREELRQKAEEDNSGQRELTDYQKAVRAMIGVKAKPEPKENDDEK
jgi:hypothetical protein